MGITYSNELTPRNFIDPFYFGLGLHDLVSRMEIRWSDGAVSTISKPLAAGGGYLISRN
ncbi:hypothetical protein [Nitrospina gracilis]|uniref:hypothetical protein n=1 Tax=Nitrospina gracilis TaxID=35801 RepID=UPI001F15EDE2|nr:hypothetical protein [Nitrospina gracilis]MCF8721440.1 hypothetical protein [Nitrospina gracilis Nb-211]